MTARKVSGRATVVDAETARTLDFASAAKIRCSAITSEPARQPIRTFTVECRPLKPPVRTPKSPRPEPKPKPKPVASAEPQSEAWVVIRRDVTLKRALAQCQTCRTVREVGLATGIPSCGCSGSRHASADSFAAAVSSEVFAAVGRHRARR
jgi:hypothetical protein